MNDLETIMVLVLLALIKLYPPQVTPLTIFAKGTDLGSAAVTLTPGDSTRTSHQSGIISITDQLIFKDGKKL